MKDMEQQLQRLRELTDHSSLEFYQNLRTVLKASYRYSINYLSHLIEEFEVDIMQNGVFYIDVINDSLLFFLKKDKHLAPLQSSLFLLIIEKIIPIGDRQSISLISQFCKKIQKKEPESSAQAKIYLESIENNLKTINLQIQYSYLYPYKDIINTWY